MRTLQQLDPARRRRRLQVIAELADARHLRRAHRTSQAARASLRELIATRRRLAG